MLHGAAARMPCTMHGMLAGDGGRIWVAALGAGPAGGWADAAEPNPAMPSMHANAATPEIFKNRVKSFSFVIESKVVRSLRCAPSYETAERPPAGKLPSSCHLQTTATTPCIRLRQSAASAARSDRDTERYPVE